MQTSLKSQFPNGSAAYKQQLDEVAQLQSRYNLLAQSSGAYSVESVKAVSATQALSKSIADQKLSLSGALNNLNNFKAAWREQAALQKSSIIQWTNTTTGKNSVDLYMPKELDSSLDSFRMKYGYINQAIGSIANQTINWGKNTQWAGRQITVGMGVPLAMVFGMMGKAALQADQELTQITKVYNTTIDTSQSLAVQQAQTDAQLLAVRKNAMADAMTMAKQYGATMQDTLQLEADLAAVGKTGNDLRQSTALVTRVATLGELDHNTALQMSISLQNAWKMSTTDLGNAFNYINDIENTTSLTTKDFAEAIPRAAAAMSTMGVSIQDTGVLLVALKQGGVDATEGMNALKSATTRLIKPTADAQKRFASMGIDIANVSREAGGNLIKILEKLGPLMQGQNEIVKQGAMAALFGTYQYNKMTVAYTNTADAYAKLQAGINDPNDQTLQAMKVAAQDPSAWAAVANQEQSQLQQSISFQWKSTLAQLKVEMADLGQSVLGVMVPIAKGVLSVVTWFNSWGDSSKKIALIIGGMIMLAGPLIMLLGLFGNLVGNVAKFGSQLSNLVLRFKVVDPEQRAAELMAKQAASAFDSEAGSIARLNMELQNLIKTQLASAAAGGIKVPGLTGQAAAFANSVGAAPHPYAGNTTGLSPSGAPLPFIVPAKNGRTMHFKLDENGKKQIISKAEADAMHTAALEADTMAAASAKTGVNIGSMIGKLGMFGIAAFSLKSMVDSSGGLLSNLTSAAMFVVMMQGAGGFTGIASMVKAIPGLITGGWGKAVSAVNNMIGKGALAAASAYAQAGGTIGASMKAMGSGLLAMLTSPLGILLAVAGSVAAFVTIINHMNETAKKQQEINNSTQAWAQTLGYAEKSYTAIASNGGQGTVISEMDARQKKVEQLTKANSALVDGLKKAKDADSTNGKLYTMALDESFKVKLSGGSQQQINEAFDVALQAAGASAKEIRDLHVKFDQVTFDNPKTITDHISKSLSDAVSSMNVSTGLGANWLRGLTNSSISQDAQDAGAKIGGVFWEGLQSASSTQDVRGVVKEVIDKTGSEFQKDDSWKNLWARKSEELKKMGVTNVQQFYELQQKYFSGGLDKKKSDQFANNFLGDQDAANVRDRYGHLMDFIWATTKDKTHMSKGEWDKLKNSGFDLANVTGVLSNDLGIMANQSNAAAAAIDNLSNNTDSYRYNAAQITSALQNTMKGYMSDVYKQADNIMSEQYAAQVKGVQNAGAARQKGFEAQAKDLQKANKAESDALKDSQDARTKAIDDQIKQTQDAATAQEDAIQAEINAENKQDALRQKLFDREKTRIERLAAMQNSNIDFNAALNSGNMDSAAKLYNTHAATVQGYQMDDQNAAAADALKAKTDGQTAKIDAIKTATQAQVDAFNAQKEGLKSVFDLETQLLQEKQQKEQDALDAAKQKDQERTQNAVDNLQKRQAMNKLELDQEVMAIKAQTPRTQKEAEAQVAALQAVYQKYGVSLNANAEEWSQYIANDMTAQIGTAAAGLANDVAWQELGAQITQALGDGSGLSGDQLKSFLATGVWPQDTAQKPPVRGRAAGYYVGDDGKLHRGMANHRGGMSGGGPNGKVSWTQQDRMGYPQNSEPFPSEIPTLLKHGEFVVNDKATANHLPLLNAINSGMDVSMLTGGAHHMGGLMGGVAQSQANAYGAIAYFALAQRMAALMNSRLQVAGMRDSAGIGIDAAPTDVSGNQKIVMDMAASKYGWTGGEWNALYQLVMHESGFKNTAKNPTSTAYGMFQFLDQTWGPYGVKKTGDPTQQSTAGLAYIKAAYGDPIAAWQKWQMRSPHWYDNGGYLMPGMGMVGNATGKPEPVFTAEQWEILSSLVGSAANVLSVPQGSKSFDSGSTNHYDVTIDLRGAVVKDDIDFTKAVKNALYEIEKKNGLNRKVGDGS